MLLGRETHISKLPPNPFVSSVWEYFKGRIRAYSYFFISFDGHLKVFSLHTIIVTQSRERIGN